MGEERNCTRFWWESLKEGPLGRPRHRWEDGIRMDLKDTGWGGELISLAQDRGWWRALVNVVMNLWVLVPRN
jgi:hypothetical protein